MQNRNNLVALCALNLVLFLCCLPAPWLRVVETSFEDGSSRDAIHSSFTSSISLLGGAFPCWLLLVGSILAVTMTLLNLSRVTSLSWLLPLAALMFSGVHYWYLVLCAQYEKYGVGPVIALVNTAFAVVLVIKADRFLKLEAQADTPSPTAPARAPGRTRIGQRKWTSGNN